jgi:hypothetical protein
LFSYTHALEVAVVEEAVYYSNRAACKSPRLVDSILIRALTPRENTWVTDYLHVRFYTAGWQNMTPPRYEQVLDDCDKALKLDPA